MGRIRFILVGAVIGLAWAASLRGFMQQLAGPDSTFTFSGTFGIIIPTGIIVGALLGWAEHQRRIGPQHRLLILAPLLVGVIPNIVSGLDPGPIGLALLAMAGGYAVSGRGPLWTRIVAGLVNLAGIAVTFLAPKPFPDLSYTTPHGLLARHPGGVPGRGPRPRLLHPDAPPRDHSRPRWSNVDHRRVRPLVHPGPICCVTSSTSRNHQPGPRQLRSDR